MDIVETDGELVSRTAVLEFELAVCGYDEVPCASAERLADPRLVVAFGDRRQLAALSALGLDTGMSTRLVLTGHRSQSPCWARRPVAI